MNIYTLAFVLGSLCGAGGTFGYVKTGSVPSLVAGLGIGALYGYAGLRILNKEPYGIELAILASVVLGGSSIPRAIRTGRPLPQALSILAATGLIYYGMKLSSQKK